MKALNVLKCNGCGQYSEEIEGGLCVACEIDVEMIEQETDYEYLRHLRLLEESHELNIFDDESHLDMPVEVDYGIWH